MTSRPSVWLERATSPVHGSSVAAFRVLFGALGAVGALRFLAYGWIDRFFVEPRFHFTYWGLSWVEPLGSAGMHAVFVALVVLGLMIAAGFMTRVSLVGFLLLFTYVETIDVTTYLNHYYLFSLHCAWLLLLPCGDTLSVDAWRARRADPGWRPRPMPAWGVWALRTQVAVVYVFAAVAKATPDWLVHGQPLGIWLSSRAEVALVGAWMSIPGAALVASWLGFLHDLLIVPALLYRRTRKLAYAALVVFHLATAALFPIGMFPYIMIASATMFFPPEWAARFCRGERARTQPPTGGRLRIALAAVLLATQVILPLRAFAYGGNVLWHEQGMRFSWRVMCREKNGSVTFRVYEAERRQALVVPARRYLNDAQEREMSSQPDLIAQLARRIAADRIAAGAQDVRVHVDAFASLNGRSMARLIDPDVDLASVSDGLGGATWILPAPTGPPLPARAVR